MYNKWMALPEFCNILRTIDNNHETEGMVIGKTSDEDGETKMCMDVENNSDDSMDDACVETDSTDGGSDAVNKEDSSSSDDDSFDDSADNSLQVEDEEVTAVEANEVMDTTSSGGNLNRRGVEIPIEVAISSRSQCCVCKEQMMPPTVTIRPRTVGCCSHVAAAIWYLSYERHQTTTNRQPSSTNTNAI
ncbi:unnamed protein product, partial [Rotaria sordida]